MKTPLHSCVLFFLIAGVFPGPAAGQTFRRSGEGVRAALVQDRDGVALCIETAKCRRLSAEAGIIVALKSVNGKTSDPVYRSEIFGAGYLPAIHRHDLPDGWPWRERGTRAELGVCLDGDDACIPVVLDFPPLRSVTSGKPAC